MEQGIYLSEQGNEFAGQGILSGDLTRKYGGG
jgi:hypothetical protein